MREVPAAKLVKLAPDNVIVLPTEAVVVASFIRKISDATVKLAFAGLIDAVKLAA